MKKFVSILMTLILVLAMCSTAFATTITISNSTDRTFKAYKLLNLTTSLKCTHGEDATHTDDCYNYAYTVNEKYTSILQAKAGEGNDIIEYLSSLSSDTGSTPGSLRAVADAIYDAVKNMDADETITGGSANVDEGYWLIADVTELDGQNKANSLVMVDTKAAGNLTINLKTDLPTIEKKVKDINDSDSTGKTTDWQDSADYDIGDHVPFKLTATLPSNVEYYDSYMLAFHDTLSAGLELVDDVEAEKLTISVGSIDVTNAFTFAANGNGFSLTCENIKAIEGINVTKDTVFVVTYYAELTEDAEIGAAGNPNEVYLEFSNDPYSDGTGNTETDKVIVFTYKVVINKTDASQKPLPGAGFTLYKMNSAGVYVAVGNAQTGAGDNGNEFTWTGLDDGNYMLKESTVPAGYNKMEDKYFTITAEHDEEATDPALTSLTVTGLGTTIDQAKGVITDTIINNTGTVLPETGAKGTMMLIMASSLAVCVAVVFMVTRKKMSVYED